MTLAVAVRSPSHRPSRHQALPIAIKNDPRQQRQLVDPATVDPRCAAARPVRAAGGAARLHRADVEVGFVLELHQRAARGLDQRLQLGIGRAHVEEFQRVGIADRRHSAWAIIACSPVCCLRP
jgi:hypothetical protein